MQIGIPGDFFKNKKPGGGVLFCTLGKSPKCLSCSRKKFRKRHGQKENGTLGVFFSRLTPVQDMYLMLPHRIFHFPLDEGLEGMNQTVCAVLDLIPGQRLCLQKARITHDNHTMYSTIMQGFTSPKAYIGFMGFFFFSAHGFAARSATF